MTRPVQSFAMVTTGFVAWILMIIGAGSVVQWFTTPAPQTSAPALASVVTPPERQQFRENYRGIPPAEFRGDRTLTVKFVDDVKVHCSKNAYACEIDGVLILPNPCTPDAAAKIGWDAEAEEIAFNRRYTWGREDYRTMVCHELGHANGWPGTHWIDPTTEDAQIRAELLDAMYADDQVYGAWYMDTYTRPLGQTDRVKGVLQKMIDAGEVEIKSTDRVGAKIRMSRCQYWTIYDRNNKTGPRKQPEACTPPTP